MLYSDGHVVVATKRYELEDQCSELGFTPQRTPHDRWDRRYFQSRRKFLATVAAGVAIAPTELIELFLQSHEPYGSTMIECLIPGLYERKFREHD